MKKHIMLLLLTAAFATKASAQDHQLVLGSRVGIGVSQFSSSSDRVLWFGAGGTGDYPLGRHLGIMGEAWVQKGGAKYQGTETVSGVFGTRNYAYQENFSIITAQIPLMPRISLGGDGLRLNIFAGPAINFNLLGASSRTYDDESYNNDNGYEGKQVESLELLHFSGLAGLGFSIPAGGGTYFVDFRYGFGLTPTLKTNNQDQQINYFAITGGLAF